MKWFGIDPGVTTGCAWWDDSSEELDGVAQVSCVWEDKRGRKGNGVTYTTAMSVACLEVVRLVSDWEPDIIVIEDFILRLGGPGGGGPASSDRQGLAPVLMTGMIWTWVQQVLPEADPGEWGSEGVEIRLQMPSDAKKVITDKRLKARGWWSTPSGRAGSLPGGGPHARDAARHIALAYRREAGGVV